MNDLDALDWVFIATAFLFQIVLITHFALRRWQFHTALRYGFIVYALSIPAATVSIWLFAAGKHWSLAAGGLLYLAWAAYGYYNEYIRKIEWRNPFLWAVGGPYLLLYLATVMFYWFPLANLYKPLWYAQGLLFVASTLLNVLSHHGPRHSGPQPV